VVTVEGLGTGGLDPVQRAFVDAGAVQCGFCTPGLIVSVHDLLRRDADPSDADIREALAGIQVSDGKVRNPSFTDYLIPTTAAAVRAATGKPLTRVPIRPGHVTETMRWTPRSRS
jgi:hypothetical protein